MIMFLIKIFVAHDFNPQMNLFTFYLGTRISAFLIEGAMCRLDLEGATVCSLLTHECFSSIMI